MNNAFSRILKYLFSFTFWFLGVYIFLFAMCFYAHVNESNIIANRADALINEITRNKSNLSKVKTIRDMVRKSKPILFEPSTIVSSLIGKREPFKNINKILRNVIVNHKYDLANLDLSRFDLERVDLSKAHMRGAKLGKVNFSGGNLSRVNFQNAFLVGARFDDANLKGADMRGAKLKRVNFSGGNLESADLTRAEGLTCDQIKSAVIDESTHFPDYIVIAGSTKSVFKCENLFGEGRVNIRGVNLENAYLIGANLSESNLSQVNFQNAFLVEARFDDANLEGANLNRAGGLTCDQIKSAVIDESTHLPDYIVIAGSTKSVFKCENLFGEGGVNIRGVNLENAYLIGANLSESNLSQVNFQNAFLVGARFDDANLTGADLRNANLMEATGITCNQINSAVINENTLFSDCSLKRGCRGFADECANILNKN
jgi:uncharacterized protein YjbI with pentapeptide repeats